MSYEPLGSEPTDAEQDAREAKASLLLRLRTSGIRDLTVLRAMEAVPRSAFAAHRYADLASRDVALPIGCGQTMPEPAFVARVLEALDCAPNHRVLEIGTGSGYTTALLARLSRDVTSIERFRTLVVEAQARLHALAVTNASLVWGDGLALDEVQGRFDRIVLHVAVERLPMGLLDILTSSGAIVYPLQTSREGDRPAVQTLVRTARGFDGTFAQVPLGAARLQMARPGRSDIL